MRRTQHQRRKIQWIDEEDTATFEEDTVDR